MDNRGLTMVSMVPAMADAPAAKRQTEDLAALLEPGDAARLRVFSVATRGGSQVRDLALGLTVRPGRLVPVAFMAVLTCLPLRSSPLCGLHAAVCAPACHCPSPSERIFSSRRYTVAPRLASRQAVGTTDSGLWRCGPARDGVEWHAEEE